MSRFAVVTGGFGFIGSHVCELLSREGWRFVVVDSLTRAAVNENFVVSLPGFVLGSAGDVADRSTWSQLGRYVVPTGTKVNAVFHLAAETHVDRSLGLDPTTLRPVGEDPLERLYRTNVLGTARVAEYALRAGAHLVHWSTDEVYGDAINDETMAWDGGGYQPATKLLREGLDPRQVMVSAFVETDPLCPSSPYAASKAASEMAVHSYARLGLRASILRPSNAYGPRQARDKLVPVAVDHLSRGRPVPLYDGGWQVRQWVHAEDVARAALKVVDLQADGTWNLGGPSLLRNADLVASLASGSGILPFPDNVPGIVANAPDRPGHDAVYYVSSRSAKKDLGWEPSRKIENDATELFAAYRAPG